jgi:hypothetical protein
MAIEVANKLVANKVAKFARPTCRLIGFCTRILTVVALIVVVLFPMPSLAVGFRDNFDDGIVDPAWTADWAGTFDETTIPGELKTQSISTPTGSPNGGFQTIGGDDFFANGMVRATYTSLPEHPNGPVWGSVHTALVARLDGTGGGPLSGIMANWTTEGLGVFNRIYFHEFDDGFDPIEGVVFIQDQQEFSITLEGEVVAELTVHDDIAQFSLTDSATPTPNVFTSTIVLQNRRGNMLDAGAWGLFSTDPNPPFFGSFPGGDYSVTWDDFCTGEGNFCNAAPGTAGDYNDDGTVNAADYVVYRDNAGQIVDFPNRDPALSGMPVGAADYAYWQERFGDQAAGGSSVDAAGVPEPGSLVLLGLLGSLALLAWRRHVGRIDAN